MKRRHVYIIILGLTLLLCCKNDKNNPFDKLIIGEWTLDSISGSFKKWDRDFVYITDNSSFWKFTYWNDKYLIDSCLPISGNEIFKDNKRVYQIQSFDSLNLRLADNYGNKFFYRKEDGSRKANYQNQLKDFISKHQTHELLIGWWKLTKATFKPFRLVNASQEISDFTMHLNKNSEATIYINDLSDSIIDYIWMANSMSLDLKRGCVLSDQKILFIDSNKLKFVLRTQLNYMPTSDTLTFIKSQPLTMVKSQPITAATR